MVHLLKVDKPREIVTDFRRSQTQHPRVTINGTAVERVSSTKFLGVYIREDLSWSKNSASLVKKPQHCKIKRASAQVLIMASYQGTTNVILTNLILGDLESAPPAIKKIEGRGFMLYG